MNYKKFQSYRRRAKELGLSFDLVGQELISAVKAAEKKRELRKPLPRQTFGKFICSR